MVHEEQLKTIFANVNEWLKFAEAKNFGLMTLNAGVVIGMSQISFNENLITEAFCYYIVIPCVSISFLISLLSVFPVLTKIARHKVDNNGNHVDNNVRKFINAFSCFIDKETEVKNIHYYGYLSSLTADKFERKFLEKTNSTIACLPYEKDLYEQILYNSRITKLKYQLFKIAAFFFFLGIILPVVILVIIMIKFCISSIFS